ncbi:MAG TPA: flagellin [Myxococcota bacterium]|nr:flagellin [Myxococcota bacterium]HND28391.1 flagellin [Myxococcota bacterium]HNH45429.1 flagellin [Myxococcota bacterium]
MGIVVRSSLEANNANKNLARTSRALSRNFEKISSGLRIARSADDAAGLGVAENLKALHRSADQAARNINDGFSLISVADGAASEVGSILTRLRELAVQSSSETLDDTERQYIRDEADQLRSEITRISAVTEFNGIAIGGTSTTLDVQVGVRGTASDLISITTGDLGGLVATAAVDFTDATSSQGSITTIDDAIDDLSSIRSVYGATENRLSNALNNIETFSEANKAAESRIRDADFGIETAALSQNQILQQAGVSILAQAKGLNQSALSLLQ